MKKLLIGIFLLISFGVRSQTVSASIVLRGCPKVARIGMIVILDSTTVTQIAAKDDGMQLNYHYTQMFAVVDGKHYRVVPIASVKLCIANKLRNVQGIIHTEEGIEKQYFTVTTP